jgi:hypothetical protein
MHSSYKFVAFPPDNADGSVFVLVLQRASGIAISPRALQVSSLGSPFTPFLSRGYDISWCTRESAAIDRLMLGSSDGAFPPDSADGSVFVLVLQRASGAVAFPANIHISLTLATAVADEVYKQRARFTVATAA